MRRDAPLSLEQASGIHFDVAILVHRFAPLSLTPTEHEASTLPVTLIAIPAKLWLRPMPSVDSE